MFEEGFCLWFIGRENRSKSFRSNSSWTLRSDYTNWKDGCFFINTYSMRVSRRNNNIGNHNDVVTNNNEHMIIISYNDKSLIMMKWWRLQLWWWLWWQQQFLWCWSQIVLFLSKRFWLRSLWSPPLRY